MITEVCMCEYATYGHGGARRDGADNDATPAIFQRVATRSTRTRVASLSVENLLNEQYIRHMTVFPNELTRTITGFPQPDITVKGSLRVRFAGG